jgi:hypothetical protein
MVNWVSKGEDGNIARSRCRASSEVKGDHCPHQSRRMDRRDGQSRHLQIIWRGYRMSETSLALPESWRGRWCVSELGMAG